MTTSSSRADDLQALWNELNQSDDQRRQHDLDQRLRQRAEQYAAPVRDDTAPAPDADDVLTFRLGDERYALNVSVVRGVRPLEKLTRVPGVPSFYRGVVNVRGQIYSALDLRRFLNLDVPSDEIPPELILVTAAKLELALLVDHIEQVQPLLAADLTPLERPFTLGVSRDELVWLDIYALFSDNRLIIGKETSS